MLSSRSMQTWKCVIFSVWKCVVFRWRWTKLQSNRRQLQFKKEVHKYFGKMKASNSNVFYVMDLSHNGQLRSAVYADPRSSLAYKKFVNVLTFNNAYPVKKYDMPFAHLFGKSHHGQLILFGCDLICSEGIEKFI